MNLDPCFNMEMSFYESRPIKEEQQRDLRASLKRKMDSPFEIGPNGERDAVDRLKRNMKLDFNSAGNKKTKLSLLQSPDLNLLKLASPELEKMIIQANGMVTTTPTPTQFIFPKHVTDEQEAYARGFVDALAELHDSTIPQPQEQEQQQSTVKQIKVTSSAVSQGVTKFITSISNGNMTYATVPTVSQGLTTTTSLPGGLHTVDLTGSVPKTVEHLNSFNMPKFQVKEEPQCVPSLDCTPPLSPINMDNQEVIKLERKRARNRVAARKCRTRKLERISRLEDKVADLKGQNTDLSTTATNLRDQVCKLKKQIIDHVNSGCQIMMSPNFSF
ncbi:transcription factor AP-1-like [Gigantopelta aegis]|uniref:transcription factor AP-1-like n=1 Tax=Gigantopelta aegis TaxID=1735272 RepID=UPI001B88DB66|nr:transcription factor AP-1-like [Gigantopelta aegis]